MRCRVSERTRLRLFIEQQHAIAAERLETARTYNRILRQLLAKQGVHFSK